MDSRKDQKRCRSCARTRAISNFGKRSQNQDGLESSCKDCVNLRQRERYTKRREPTEVYYGNQCREGHTLRYTIGNGCVECQTGRHRAQRGGRSRAGHETNRVLVPDQPRPKRTEGAGRERDSMGRKQCTAGCGEWKDKSDFAKDKRSPGGLHPYCRPCHKWYRINRIYGLTRERFFEIVDLQGGHCATCSETEGLTVDHDHGCCAQPNRKTCGKCVRAILCGRCNSALGLARDDENVLDSLANYLRGFK